MTPLERRRQARDLRKWTAANRRAAAVYYADQVTPAERAALCGTEAGYAKHLYVGSRICADCRTEFNRAERARAALAAVEQTTTT